MEESRPRALKFAVPSSKELKGGAGLQLGDEHVREVLRLHPQARGDDELDVIEAFLLAHGDVGGYFRKLPREVVRKVARCVGLKVVAPQQVLFYEADPGAFWAIILSGAVSLFAGWRRRGSRAEDEEEGDDGRSTVLSRSRRSWRMSLRKVASTSALSARSFRAPDWGALLSDSEEGSGSEAGGRVRDPRLLRERYGLAPAAAALLPPTAPPEAPGAGAGRDHRGMPATRFEREEALGRLSLFRRPASAPSALHAPAPVAARGSPETGSSGGTPRGPRPAPSPPPRRPSPRPHRAPPRPAEGGSPQREGARSAAPRPKTRAVFGPREAQDYYNVLVPEPLPPLHESSSFPSHRSGPARSRVPRTAGFIKRLLPGAAFGETALARHVPRTATAATLESPAELLLLTRQDFAATLLPVLEAQLEERAAFLRALPIFAGWEEGAVEALVPFLSPSHYARSEAVVEEGEVAPGLFFLRVGTCRLVRRLDPPPHPAPQPRPDDAPGGRGAGGRGGGKGRGAELTRGEAAALGVVAESAVEVLFLPRVEFARRFRAPAAAAALAEEAALGEAWRRRRLEALLAAEARKAAPAATSPSPPPPPRAPRPGPAPRPPDPMADAEADLSREAAALATRVGPWASAAAFLAAAPPAPPRDAASLPASLAASLAALTSPRPRPAPPPSPSAPAGSSGRGPGGRGGRAGEEGLEEERRATAAAVAGEAAAEAALVVLGEQRAAERAEEEAAHAAAHVAAAAAEAALAALEGPREEAAPAAPTPPHTRRPRGARHGAPPGRPASGGSRAGRRVRRGSEGAPGGPPAPGPGRRLRAGPGAPAGFLVNSPRALAAAVAAEAAGLPPWYTELQAAGRLGPLRAEAAPRGPPRGRRGEGHVHAAPRPLLVPRPAAPAPPPEAPPAAPTSLPLVSPRRRA
eukprot:tig00000444_g808.t1